MARLRHPGRPVWGGVDDASYRPQHSAGNADQPAFVLGILVLGLAIVRLGWRWTHPEPMPLDGLPPWQVKSARAIHFALYLLLFVLPVLGWINASYRGFAVSFFRRRFKSEVQQCSIDSMAE
jgi:cytochrome b561